MGKKKQPVAQHDDSEEEHDEQEQNVIDISKDPRILAALQQKLASLQGQSSGLLESLPAEVQRRVKALKNLQSKQVAVAVQFEKELAALEKKFAEQYAPIFAQRTKIVAGEYEPTEEEAHWSEPEEDEEEGEEGAKEEKKPAEPSANPVSGIPHFWLTVLQHCDDIAMTIQEHDLPILEHLKDITVALNEPAGTGFTLQFHFAANEFFTDTILTKKYTIELDAEEKSLVYEGPVFSKSEGCEIHWNAGKNVTVKLVKKKQRKKGGAGAGQTRTVTKAVKQDSFFNFFSPPQAPTEEHDDEDEHAGELAQLIEMDFEIGEIIREKLIPHAVLWFTGEALQYEGDDDFYGGEEGEEGEEHEHDEDDEDHDPNYKPPAAATGEKPECKQS